MGTGSFLDGFFRNFTNVWSQSRQQEEEMKRKREQDQLRMFENAAQGAAARGDTEGVANVFRMQSEFVKQGAKGGKKGQQGQLDILNLLADGIESGMMPVEMQSKESLQQVNPVNAHQELTQQMIPQMQVAPQVMPIAGGNIGFNQQGQPEMVNRSLQAVDVANPNQVPQGNVLQNPINTSLQVRDFENRKRFMTPQSELDERDFRKRERLLQVEGDIATKRALQTQQAMLDRQLQVQAERGKIQLKIAEGIEKRDINKLTTAIMADNPLLSQEEARQQAGGMITDKFRATAEVAKGRIDRMKALTLNAQNQLREKQREFDLTYGQRERQGNARIATGQMNAETARMNMGINAGRLKVQQQIADANKAIGQMGQIISESNNLQDTLANGFASVAVKAQAEARLKVLDNEYQNLSKRLESLQFNVNDASAPPTTVTPTSQPAVSARTVNIGGKDFQVGSIHQYQGKRVRVEVDEQGNPKLTVVP